MCDARGSTSRLDAERTGQASSGAAAEQPGSAEALGEKPDPDSAGPVTPSVGWKVLAESVQGVSHEKSGAMCQDSHFFLRQPENVLIAAVADGAGSATHAEIGAALAARTAVEALAHGYTRPELQRARTKWEPILLTAMTAARDAVAGHAHSLGVDPRELASTLILLLATPEYVVVSQIGDGAVVVEGADGELKALTKPQTGEYLNETIFLVSPDALDQAQTAKWIGQVRFLAAFSDGLQMLALRMRDNTPYRPFFAPLFRFLQDQSEMEEAGRQLRSFLTSSRITDRSDDDITLLLAQWPTVAQ